MHKCRRWRAGRWWAKDASPCHAARAIHRHAAIQHACYTITAAATTTTTASAPVIQVFIVSLEAQQLGKGKHHRQAGDALQWMH